MTARSAKRSGTVQLITGVCSAVFLVGTTVQNFVIVNSETLASMMQLAGQTAEQAASAAPGFLVAFRLVGCLYIVGNAAGVLALRRDNSTVLFWIVVVVNVTQAAGVVLIPPEVFQASLARYGVVGLLPSIVTDGGALLLSLFLLGGLVRYRRPWAQGPRSEDTASSPDSAQVHGRDARAPITSRSGRPH